MSISDQQIKKLKRLISIGFRIHLGFLIEYGFYDWIEGIHDLIRREKPISFRFSYEDWYSKALVLIENFQPSRLEEFILLYKNKNQEVAVSPPYTIFDFWVGNEIRRSHDYYKKRDSVKQNFERQLQILKDTQIDLDILSQK
jgi:hypothetical protein